MQKINASLILSLLLMGMLLAIKTVHAADSNNASYEASTGILRIPNVEVNGIVTYSNAILRLNNNGSFSVVETQLPSVNNTQKYPLISSASVDLSIRINGVIALQDGSVWQITGASVKSYLNDDYVVGDPVKPVKKITIYQSSSSMSSPLAGSKADYFMIIDGSNVSFFVKKL